MKRTILILALFSLCGISHARPKFEISPLFTFYSGDSLRAFFGGTVQSVLHFNESYWVGAEGFVGAPRVEASNTNVISDRLFGYALGTFFWNMTGTLGKENNGNPIDLYTSFALGPLFVGDQTELTGSIGGGMNVHFSSIPWFLVKFDLKNLFYVLDRPTGKSFQSDMALSLGVSALF